jgi:hypothetical protein
VSLVVDVGYGLGLFLRDRKFISEKARSDSATYLWDLALGAAFARAIAGVFMW